ncbi:MAG: hypothetical protein AAFP22_23110, partial [Planctomycetota bacterium]
MRFASLLLTACTATSDPIAPSTRITPEPEPPASIAIELDLYMLEIAPGSTVALPVRVVRPDDQPVTLTLTNLPPSVPPVRLDLEAGEPAGVILVEPGPATQPGTATLARLAAETPAGSIASHDLPTLVFDEDGLGPFQSGRGARLSLGSQPHETFEVAVDDAGGFIVIGTVGGQGRVARFLGSGFPDVHFGQ